MSVEPLYVRPSGKESYGTMTSARGLGTRTKSHEVCVCVRENCQEIPAELRFQWNTLCVCVDFVGALEKSLLFCLHSTRFRGDQNMVHSICRSESVGTQFCLLFLGQICQVRNGERVHFSIGLLVDLIRFVSCESVWWPDAQSSLALASRCVLGTGHPSIGDDVTRPDWTVPIFPHDHTMTNRPIQRVERVHAACSSCWVMGTN